MEIKNLGIPIILLSAIWGTFDVVLKTVEFQNRVRDAVRTMARDARIDAFWSDWIWPWIGLLWFLAIFTVVIATIPRFATPDSKATAPFLNGLCLTAATLPALAFLGILIGGCRDMSVFFR
jgi:hypothetical protein